MPVLQLGQQQASAYDTQSAAGHGIVAGEHRRLPRLRALRRGAASEAGASGV